MDYIERCRNGLASGQKSLKGESAGDYNYICPWHTLMYRRLPRKQASTSLHQIRSRLLDPIVVACRALGP